MQNILSIDYGTSHTGIALKLGIDNPIVPCDTINDRDQNTLIAKIIDICQNNQITDIVIGLPLNLRGEIGHQAKIVQEFGENLQKSLPTVAIYFADERFSSKFISDQIENSDSYAAYEILDSFIKRSNPEKK